MATEEAKSEVDVEEIMARVRARIRARGGATAPALQVDGAAGFGEDHLKRELSSSLHQAGLVSSYPLVDHRLGWRTPIIGPIWMAVRRRLHQEIRIYLDATHRPQITFNTSIARALTALVGALETVAWRGDVEALRATASEVEQLREEVAALREQVRLLHQRLDGNGPLGSGRAREN